ncbi:MAG: LamG-like jellyroll fold domain-containing protein [Thermoguttaceae bacterium]
MTCSSRRHLFAVVLLILVALGLTAAAAEPTPWPWQDAKARVLPTGDLEWSPQPFVYVAGDAARCIDYEGGNDANPGTRQQPWRHHPWDAAAEGKAAAATGIDTYVFKRGVMYRGELVVRQSGKPGHPIRLTSDPAWGEGQAAIVGSERVCGWRRGLAHPKMPEPDKVWSVDLGFAPRNVWMIRGDGGVVRIPLARTPNWQPSDPDDVKSEWFQFNNPDNRDVWGAKATVNNVERPKGYDTVNLTRDADYYKDALVWSEYGWVMGTPYPSRVAKFDPVEHSLVFGGQWGDGIGAYHYPRYTRYYLEDKPQYLDDAKSGEFWFDKQGNGGRLYLRLPGDADPNGAHIEVAKRTNLIDSSAMSHVHISGLAMRFTNVWYDLPALPGKNVDVACIRLLGSGSNLLVANCTFEHVHLPIRFKAVGQDDVIDGVVIRDNLIQDTDHGAIIVADGGEWGQQYTPGRLLDVKVLRNRLHEIGHRPTRYGQGHAIEVESAVTAEVAGNVLDRLYGAGIFVYGGKEEQSRSDRPLTRILVHHNKVVDSLLNNNDWGGIETWQGGPAYVFDNISGNPGGYKLWGHMIDAKSPDNARFGHAFYMDGAFKQYYFNNIAWGKSKDSFDRLGNTAAFQEIIGYSASIFNNTVYNFVNGSRRQVPLAGRNRYMGNIWQGIGHLVFRHADPKNLPADPNAADARSEASDYHHASNAYVSNVFYDLPKMLAVFEASGRWHGTLEGFRRALAMRGSIGDPGELVAQPPLRDAANHDFRPTAAARGKGVRVFVPWGLYATVAEWDFYHAGNDPTLILDDHFHLASYFVGRDTYYKNPTYPLRTVHMGEESFVQGPLEDWVRSALKFNGVNQYAMLAQASLAALRQQGKAPKIENKPHEKIAFETPTSFAPDRPGEVKLRLHGVKPGLKIKADLHWQRENGQFGGMNIWGGPGHTVTGEGPYVFKFTPQAKPGLAYYIVTAYTTPTGEWDDHVDVAHWGVPATAVAPAEGFRSPSIDKTNFLVEAHFRTEPGHTGGVLLQKKDGAGYALVIDSRGGVTFQVAGQGESGQVESKAKVNDGRWHHILAEADRKTKELRLYVDGHRDAEAGGVGPVSITNRADLYVGGRPDGGCLAGTIDFMRVALGTLDDAKTTIEELYAWQFSGPFLQDFLGRQPNGRRDAGAIQHVD